MDAIRARGSIIGVAMTAWRLLRCNPLSHGGVDYAVKNNVNQDLTMKASA